VESLAGTPSVARGASSFSASLVVRGRVGLGAQGYRQAMKMPTVMMMAKMRMQRVMAPRSRRETTTTGSGLGVNVTVAVGIG